MPNSATVQMLLQQTEKLLAIRQEQLRRTGGCFNIFSILDIERKEVQTHNRLLYELLNPNGSHGMGDRFLREFFTIVLDANYPDTPVQVYREYLCSAGQIDLLLLNQELCYPIEIKISAPDQPLQIKRYADYAASRAEDSWVFYLTLDGHEPAEYSTGGDTDIHYTCILFGQEVRNWLVQCGKIAWAVPTVTGIIQQYIQLIDKLTNRMEDVYMDMIQDMIGGSRGNFESAAAIAEAVTGAKAALLCRIFSGIEEHVGDRMEQSWSNYNTCAEPYSIKPHIGKNLPYLCYKLAVFGCNTLYFEFAIDINGWLYDSIYFMDEDGDYDQFTTDRLPSMLPNADCKAFIRSRKKGEDEPWWKFLPDTTEELLPDFRHYNDRCLDLFDKPQFDAWMQQVYQEIDDCLDRMKEIGLLGYEGPAVQRRKVRRKVTKR